MNRWQIATVVGAAGIIWMLSGSIAAYNRYWEEMRAHKSAVTDRALKALGEISPEDQATIDAYNAMKERWNQRVQKATDGKINLSDLELQILLSRTSRNIHF